MIVLCDGVNFIPISEALITYNSSDLSFSINPGIMVKDTGEEDITEYYDSVVIKETGKEGETSYEATITLYSLFDGKSGSSGATPKFVQINPVGYAFVKASDSELYLPESITLTATLSETVNASAGVWKLNGNTIPGSTGSTSVVITRDMVIEGETTLITYHNDGRTWTASVWKTKDGENGQPGKDGENGKDGADGQPGKDGAPGEDAVLYSVKPSVPMIKKRLAGNQTLIAYLRKVKAFDSYVPKPAITAKKIPAARYIKATHSLILAKYSPFQPIRFELSKWIKSVII